MSLGRRASPGGATPSIPERAAQRRRPRRVPRARRPNPRPGARRTTSPRAFPRRRRTARRRRPGESSPITHSTIGCEHRSRAVTHRSPPQRGEGQQRPIGIVWGHQATTQPSQCVQIRCRTVDVSRRASVILSAASRPPPGRPVLIRVCRLDGSDVRHEEGRQPPPRRLNDPRGRPTPYSFGHRAPPACRKLSAVFTSSSTGMCGPSGRQVHATLRVLSRPRMLTLPAVQRSAQRRHHRRCGIGTVWPKESATHLDIGSDTVRCPAPGRGIDAPAATQSNQRTDDGIFAVRLGGIGPRADWVHLHTQVHAIDQRAGQFAGGSDAWPAAAQTQSRGLAGAHGEGFAARTS